MVSIRRMAELLILFWHRPQSSSTASQHVSMQQPANPTAAAIYNHAFPLSSAEILGRIHKDAEWVLIGEASHGTKEFYETRASITKDLIDREGFNAVAVEAGAWSSSRIGWCGNCN